MHRGEPYILAHAYVAIESQTIKNSDDTYSPSLQKTGRQNDYYTEKKYKKSAPQNDTYFSLVRLPGNMCPRVVCTCRLLCASLSSVLFLTCSIEGESIVYRS